MTEDPGGKGVPRLASDEELDRRLQDPRVAAWFDENLAELRGSVSGQRILFWSLGISFVIGLAAHIGGYLLITSATTEPLGLLADLLHALGWALWTGVVVVLFVQVIPETKRRQVKRAIDTRGSTCGRCQRRPGVWGEPRARDMMDRGFVIETQRLRLRPMTLDDVDTLEAVLGPAEIMRWYARRLRSARDRGAGTGQFLGDCGRTIQLLEEPHVELGWHTRRDPVGRGVRD